jgi:hypothetical protein
VTVTMCQILQYKSWPSQKETKTRLLKLSKTSRIVIAFSRHKMESQMVTIVTVTMRYLGSLYRYIENPVVARDETYSRVRLCILLILLLLYYS